MAVGPIRGLLIAHAQAGWNRSAKELGRRGRLFLWGILILLALLGVVPLLVILVVAGYGLGGTLGDPELGPVSVRVLGGLLGAFALGGGLVGGLVGGSKQLAWERYRGFPLAARKLYLAELLAGLGDLMPLAVAGCVTGLLLGLAVAQPATLPLLPWVALLTVGLLLSIRLLVGSLAARLLKRLHLLLGLLVAAAWVGGALLGSSLQARDLAAETRFLALAQQAGRFGQTLARALPTTWALEGLVAATRGQALRALAWQAYPLLFLLACMVLGSWLLNREGAALQVQPTGAAARLWSFRNPALGLARLQWLTLLGSHLGKFGFAMPLMTLVLIKGPFARVGPVWAVPGAFLYLALVGNQFLFNQFGLDREGVKALFLLPIPARDLLRGKLLGFAAYQGVQVLLLSLLLGLLLRPSPRELFGSLLLMTCVFLVLATLGQLFSVLYPRPMARKSLQSGQLPLPSVLASLGASLGAALVFGGSYFLLNTFAPGWLLAGMAALAGCTFLGHRLCQPTLAELWHRRREAIVQAVG